MHEKQRKH